MKKKIIWLAISCFMVLAMVLATCAPATTTTPMTPTAPTTPAKPTVPTTPTTPTTPTVPTTPAAPATEVPKYGGTLYYTTASPFRGVFDPVYTHQASLYTASLTNENLYVGDWAKGPAGTGETTFETWVPLLNLNTPALAESYELPDDQTIIYHLRKGIHWALNPSSEASRLVGGRELVADDVVFSIRRIYNMDGQAPTSQFLGRMTPPERPVSAKALDKYTVELKGTKGWIQSLFEATYSFLAILPPEPITKFGAKAYEDWKNSVGTGPFMLNDFVSGSIATFVRNPNYWMKDPVGPGKGNQLPYLEGAKMLIIPDRSTLIAALRTAKIHQLSRVLWEDFVQLTKTTPQLKYFEEPPIDPQVIAMRLDKPEQPWRNLKVRQALQMAINRDEIVKDYFGGHAEKLAFPASPISMYISQYTPLNQQSQTVQDMYTYQPDKAKKMLESAGYPKGFKIEVIAQAKDVDLLSLVKAYWTKIGVDMQISVRELGVYNSIGAARSHTEAYFTGGSVTTPYAWHKFQPADASNLSMVDDPVMNKAQEDFKAVYVFDEPKAAAIVKGAYKYSLEQAWYIDLPGPYTYTMWWPWVKNYHGEWIVGYTTPYNWPTWVWLDQTLKKSMGF
ncbi:MAG: ABC transporter substrate-binding protein [Chloroflexi bacterium]|nr:ABC transporter substrate-binding protein [Chloroflexota bacterium]